MNFLLRHESIVMWRRLSDSSPESLAQLGNSISPFAQKDMTWKVEVSPSLNGKSFAMFMASPRPIQSGTCLRFVAVWKWIAGVRSDLLTKEAVFLVDMGVNTPETTLLYYGFPIFSGIAEKDEILRYIHAAHELEVKSNPETIFVPSGAPELGITFNQLDQIPWLSAPIIKRSRVAEIWKAHRENILAGLSIIFVALGFTLHQSASKLESKITAIKRDSVRQERSAQRLSENKTNQAVRVFNESILQVPRKSHLTTFHYDAAQQTVHIEGRAANYDLISEYTALLSKKPPYRDVQCERSRLEQMDGQSIVSFSLKGIVR